MKTIPLSLAIGLLMAVPAWAGDCGGDPAACGPVETCGSPNCCAHCGRHCGCEKYCKVVPYMKEVKKTVWVVKCEDFCPSLPGNPLGNRCCDDPNGCGVCRGGSCAADQGCNACGGRGCEGCCKPDPCASELAKRQTPPKCGCVRTKKTLEKKEIVCKVPSYKCVVVYGCANCGDCGSPAPAGNVDPKPAAPAPSPKPPSALPPVPPKMTHNLDRLPELQGF
jgi:hypothetical protein